MAGVPGRSGGRNAKSLAAHRRDGTYRPHRHSGANEVQVAPGRPQAPPTLAGEALAEWERMCARLEATGVLSSVDDAVLARYCRLHARAVRLEDALSGAPAFVHKVTVDGAGVEHSEPRVHPGFAQLRQYDLALRQYLVEFGLTPSTRTRVTPTPSTEPKPKTPLEVLQEQAARMRRPVGVR